MGLRASLLRLAFAFLACMLAFNFLGTNFTSSTNGTSERTTARVLPRTCALSPTGFLDVLAKKPAQASKEAPFGHVNYYANKAASFTTVVKDGKTVHVSAGNFARSFVGPNGEATVDFRGGDMCRDSNNVPVPGGGKRSTRVRLSCGSSHARAVPSSGGSIENGAEEEAAFFGCASEMEVTAPECCGDSEEGSMNVARWCRELIGEAYTAAAGDDAFLNPDASHVAFSSLSEACADAWSQGSDLGAFQETLVQKFRQNKALVDEASGKDASTGGVLRRGLAGVWRKLTGKASRDRPLFQRVLADFGGGKLVCPTGRTDPQVLVGSRSQVKEDVNLLNHFFFEDPLLTGNPVPFRTGLTFLEMGAFDGITFSNTFYAEQCLGWKGLLLEASPKNFAALQENAKTYGRSNAVLEHLATCAPPQTHVEFAFSEDHNSATDGVEADMPSSFKRAWDVDGKTTARIPCEPLTETLRRHGVTHLDLFSLDVEGGEETVLLNLDFQQVTVDVLVVEQNEHDTAKNARVATLLTATHGMVACANDHGRFLSGNGANEVYVSERFAHKCT
mmetsp:Transcript_87882/g.175794  ORF Transcript_87882/g.175794 Transcript_87882/m.175794 type:complete len:561 (-) Transcript_87882:57-1739(-)